MQISRQAIYRTPQPRRARQLRPPEGLVDTAIVEVAKANPTDGTRMVAALTSRETARRSPASAPSGVMREQRLLQRHRPSGRRRRPGFFRVERPGQLWHMDMTSVWVADHGWCYLNAAIDCCTGEIPAWGIDLHCRAAEAIAVANEPWSRMGSSQVSWSSGPTTAPPTPAGAFGPGSQRLGITHRRGGYRDPESQAFIESWFGKLKERAVWRSEYETLEDARAGIGAHVERYHRRPHQFLGYRTPLEVAETWQDADRPRKTVA